MASLRDPRHVDIARALLHHPESSDADRLEGFRGLSQSVALGLLGQAWAGLPKNCQVNAAFAVLFSDRLIAEGLIKQGTTILLQVPQENRDKDLEQRLIRILIRDARTEAMEEAQDRIARGWAAGGERESWIGLLEEMPVPGLDARRLAAIRESLPDPVKGEPARLALLAARIDIAARRIQVSAIALRGQFVCPYCNESTAMLSAKQAKEFSARRRKKGKTVLSPERNVWEDL